MADGLCRYFPMIRTKEQILQEIYGREDLLDMYLSWEPDRRELFLDMFTGAKGVKMLYDSFFKIVFDPEIHPERLERLLSQLLKQEIRIIEILPVSSVKIADDGDLLIMDIVVQLQDGSVADVECQKNGYAFPGQRAACYSADLLMRQYRRVKRQRAKQEKKFSYQDIKNVYTVIFYEKSPGVFREKPEHYIHHGFYTTDTGADINLLQEYIFITLDIYFKIHQNSIVDNELDAWLMFLGTDDPEQIISLIGKYPYFMDLYRDVYEACCNTERIMHMFSEELKMLDRNTVQYMIDEMEKQLQDQKSLMEKQTQIIDHACRALIEESRRSGMDRDGVVGLLCEKLGVGKETAQTQVDRFWNDKEGINA